jgi:hypothetical protein
VKTPKEVLVQACATIEGEEAPVLFDGGAVDDLIKALDAAGFVIVPKEPTPEMVAKATYVPLSKPWREVVAETYRRMVA